MRQLILAASLGIALLSSPTTSHADVPSVNGDLFVNGSVGQSHSNLGFLASRNDKNDIGYGVNVGYRAHDTWGFEAGYVNLGNSEIKGNFADHSSYVIKPRVSGWTVGGNGKFNFAQHWFVSGRLGAFFSNTKVTSSVGGAGSVEDTAHDTNLYAGLGAGYNFSRSLSLSITYDHYTAKATTFLTGTNSVGLLSGTLEYRFGI